MRAHQCAGRLGKVTDNLYIIHLPQISAGLAPGPWSFFSETAGHGAG